MEGAGSYKIFSPDSIKNLLRNKHLKWHTDKS